MMRGPVAVDDAAGDLLTWATRIAERYVPAEEAEQWARRTADEGELLCRLHMERISSAREVAR
jgi:hypothetical protein